MMAQHMLELVVTAWLGAHLVGAAQMGPMPSSDNACEKHGQTIVRILSKQQRRKDKRHRVRFDWDCYQSPVLKI